MPSQLFGTSLGSSTSGRLTVWATPSSSLRLSLGRTAPRALLGQIPLGAADRERLVGRQPGIRSRQRRRGSEVAGCLPSPVAVLLSIVPVPRLAVALLPAVIC